MFTHTDATGRTMLVAEMTDSHLLNMIKMYLTRVKQCSEYIDAVENGEPVKVNALQRTVYGDQANPMKKEMAEKLLKTSFAALPRYVMEACLRGLNVTTELQETFKRSAVYTPVMPTLFLNEKNKTSEYFDPDYPLHK